MPTSKAVGTWTAVVGAVTGGAALLFTFVFDPASPEGEIPVIPPFHGYLTWTAPIENVDETPLVACVPEDLADSGCLDGFILYAGPSTRNYDETMKIEDQSLRNVMYDGTQYGEVERFFAMTAYSRKGNMSAFSGEVSKVLSPDPAPIPDPEPEPPGMYEMPVLDIN